MNRPVTETELLEEFEVVSKRYHGLSEAVGELFLSRVRAALERKDRVTALDYMRACPDCVGKAFCADAVRQYDLGKSY